MEEKPTFSPEESRPNFGQTPLLDTPLPDSSQVPAFSVLGTFVIFSLLGTVVFGGLTFLVGAAYGLSTDEITGIVKPDASPTERSVVRWMLAFSHLGTFVLPGLLTVLIFYGKRFGQPSGQWLRYLRADRKLDWTQIGLGILLLLAALPMVHYLYGVNRALPLPEWMRAMESQTTDAIKGILQMDSPIELMANIVIMALIPAIGEELVFRGILQQQIMRRLSHPLWAILLSGAIFSMIHMQFEGFLPRWLLGVLLGWLFWKSQNLWVPVVAHFFNNAFQVVGQYMYGQKLSTIDFEQDIEVPWFAALVSLFLMGLTVRFFENYKAKP